MKIEYLNGFKTLKFGRYVVQEKKEGFNGVYFIENRQLIIHKKTWKQATKIASLLEEAYRKGYCEGYDEALDNSEE
ncbi:MAG: hypothetical protein IJN03_03220 [Bacilli bacterium]|nr:hypothetical protein [Bacilli bacterium]